jgi:Tol biopolymer transport system component
MQAMGRIVGGPARNGRYLPYTDMTGSLWLWDRVLGSDHRVTSSDGTQDGRAVFSLASPDGRQVAYEWQTGRDQFELRIIEADGSEPRPLVPAGLASRYRPLEYSREGAQILCFFDQRDGRRDLALVAADGTVTVIDRFHENAPQNASLSPDARSVVYARPQSSTGATADRQQRLFIAAVDGTGPRDLVPADTVQADDRDPLWTPDGDVVFISNRGRTSQLWMIDLEDGVARGEPFIVARNIDPIGILGLTDDGSFFYWQQKEDFEVHLIGLDPAAGKISGQPARINPEDAGGHVGGSWSPNGQHFIYIDRRANALKVKSLRSQVTREVKPALIRLGNVAPRWSPDSRSVLVRGTSLRNELGYFSVNLESSQTTLLVPMSPTEEGNYSGPVEWSLDGSAVRYWYRPKGIIYRKTDSTGEGVIVPASEISSLSLVRFATSPKEDWVFFAGRLKDGGTVFKVGRVDGAFQEVRRFPELASLQHWSADGREVYFVARPAAGQAFHLLAMAAFGGAARDLGTLPNWSPANQQIAVRADGREVSYTQGQNSSTFWVLEHFLPNSRPR